MSRMKPVLLALSALSLTAVATSHAAAQATGTSASPRRSTSSQPAVPRMKEEKKGLLAQATVTPDSARALALREVPNGRIRESEIEQEKGTLVYSFDIKVAGKSGIEEVLIDAKSGAVVAHEHEGPKAEASERAQEAREAKTAKKGQGSAKP